jgi:signal transduction histidine kinase
VFDVEVSLTRLRDDDLICVCRDVTQRKHADEALRQYARRLKTLQEIDRAILAAGSPSEIAAAALHHLRQLLPFLRASVMAWDDQAGEGTLYAVDSQRKIELGVGARLGLEAFGGEVVRHGEVNLVNDVSTLADAPFVKALKAEGLRSWINVPLISQNKLIGTLNVGWDAPGVVPHEAVEIAREVADSLAIAIQQARLHEQVEHHAAALEQRVAERTADLEAFSYSVSHDLRTPLLTIDGFARMVLEDYAAQLDEEGRRMLATIRTNTQNMGQLIDDLLAFARLGRQEMRPVGIEMDKLAALVFDELTTLAADRTIKFTVSNLPVAYGDLAMIRQVFVNLISNAIKFTKPRETALVAVGARARKNENIYFVEDNGVGFDMSYADKLFGVFQRLHTDEEFAGTGVGLAFVKRIIDRHEGRVWAEGQIDRGATVYFSLPRKQEKS